MRARNIKPGFFKNDSLADCGFEARLLYIGLWCLADRDGYIEYRPRRIKAEVFPYDSVNVEKLLDELRHYLLFIGNVNEQFLQVLNFDKHQSPHKNEKPSSFEHLQDYQVISCNFTEFLPDSLIEDVRNEDTRNEESGELTPLIELLKPEFPILTPAQIGAVKVWIGKGKTLDDIQNALIKTAGSQRSATRWGWIVDEMNKVDKPDKPKKGRLRK